MLAAFATTILFSISAICGNRTAKMLGGTEANFWRLAFAAVLLAAYAHTLGGGVGGRGLTIFFVSGCIGFGVGDMALFQTLPRLGSRLSVMLTLCLSSPMAALIEWVWLGTGLSLAEVLCALLILAGVALALAPSEHLHLERRTLLAGLGFGLLAALCQAVGAVMSRKAYALAASAGESIDGITAAYQRLLGGVLVGAVVLIWVKRTSVAPTQRGRWRQAWPWVLANGLAGPALGVSFYQWALKLRSAGVVLPIVALTPLVIIPFSYYLEGERPSRRSLLGGALAVCGAAALGWVAGHPR
jgi:drug/metabolite transporter (DMT)-like permease